VTDRALGQPAEPVIRLAELMAALSLATDLSMGQPIEHALTACVLAVRLGEQLGLSPADLRDVYYQALLRYIGCNAETHTFATLFGDELALRTAFATVDIGRQSEVLGAVIRRIWQANAGASPFQAARMVAQGVVAAPGVFREALSGHCEVAQRLAARLGFGEGLVLALGQLYERWDGRGLPAGLAGEEIAPAVRVVSLAQDVITFRRLGGIEAAVAVARRRAGGAYDPRMAEQLCRFAPTLLAGLDEEPSWDAVLALEPGGRTTLAGSELDLACQAIADFADIKSPFTLNHSSGVAQLAAEAARRCGLPDADVVAVRRAGLLHDVGRVGISASIWEKPGPLSEREWERVRLHTYYTERILARPAALTRLGALAALHHERLDGSGYHRGARAADLTPAASILAAADAYHAMLEPRPHRPARTPEAAASVLQAEAQARRLDRDAVEGVLAAGGHRVSPARRALAGGLTEREVQVLRLIARGQPMKQVAQDLSISRKTVDNHIQHIYAKLGVSTRAGATLFAMEHALLDDPVLGERPA
jgi:HD-GYP domain-containing protein (c-di-GMP phosphodiesterase class II)